MPVQGSQPVLQGTMRSSPLAPRGPAAPAAGVLWGKPLPLPCSLFSLSHLLTKGSADCNPEFHQQVRATTKKRPGFFWTEWRVDFARISKDCNSYPKDDCGLCWKGCSVFPKEEWALTWKPACTDRRAWSKILAELTEGKKIPWNSFFWWQIGNYKDPGFCRIRHRVLTTDIHHLIVLAN